MQGAEFDELVADIKKNGLVEPIVLLEDKILDGRNRYRACIAARVDPTFRPFTGDDPAAYVTSANVRRRHLTAEQKRELIAKLLKANPHPIEQCDREAGEGRRQDRRCGPSESLNNVRKFRRSKPGSMSKAENGRLGSHLRKFRRPAMTAAESRFRSRHRHRRRRQAGSSRLNLLRGAGRKPRRRPEQVSSAQSGSPIWFKPHRPRKERHISPAHVRRRWQGRLRQPRRRRRHRPRRQPRHSRLPAEGSHEDAVHMTFVYNGHQCVYPRTELFPLIGGPECDRIHR